MTDPAPSRPRRTPAIARAEQALLVALVLLVAGGVAWRLWRDGAFGREIVVEPAPEPGYRVDLNAADWHELSLVPGLGEKLGKGIVALRASGGGRFERVEDILAVDGIGAKTFARAAPYLFVRDGPADPGAEPVEMIDP